MRPLGAGQRVLLGDIFEADLRPALVLDPRLPQEIAGKPRDIAAILDKAVDRVAHARAPVFVMPDKDRAGIVIQHARHAKEVMLGDDIEFKSVALGPADKMAFIAGPAG